VSCVVLFVLCGCVCDLFLFEPPRACSQLWRWPFSLRGADAASIADIARQVCPWTKRNLLRSAQRYHDRKDASSMVTAGATANTTVKNSRASRESGLLCSHSHGESIDIHNTTYWYTCNIYCRGAKLGLTLTLSVCTVVEARLLTTWRRRCALCRARLAV